MSEILLYITPLFPLHSRRNPYMHHLTDYDRKKSWNIDCKCFSFFRNDVLPIVMGAAPEDYKRAAPYHSFIHVDEFETPKDLAEYLYKVDKNDTLYNEYFRWKGTGENINTFFWCRICSMIHEVGENNYSLVYHDLDRWWRGPGICIGQSRWRDNRKTRDNVIINKYGLGFGNWSFQQNVFLSLWAHCFFHFGEISLPAGQIRTRRRCWKISVLPGYKHICRISAYPSTFHMP